MMDSRHAQHSYSRSASNPYSHAPFPPSSTSQAPFPPSSHAQNGRPYPEHQRRTSDAQYYPSTYARDSAPLPNTGHARHASSNSIGHGAPIRNMMPPNSPPQNPPSNTYAGAISRGPPPSLGLPTAFPNGRDLPSLSSLQRPASTSSSMSISSMLGGPPPPPREAAPMSQYAAPMSSVAHSSSAYAPTVHVSPRLANPAPDFARFRRPQTPEQRLELQGPRNHRANSAGSPPRAGLATPEAHRYSTPQAYQARPPPAMSGIDDRRDHYPLRVPNPNSAVPARPNSQPQQYIPPRGRPMEMSYNEQVEELERQSLERRRRALEEEQVLRRERERRETGYSGQASLGRDEAPYSRHYTAQPAPYGAQQEARDASWPRRMEAPVAERQIAPPRESPATSNYEYPRADPSQSYAARHGDQYLSENRYPPTSYGSSMAPASVASYASPPQERQRMQQNQSSLFGNVAPMPQLNTTYRPLDSPRRPLEDAPPQRLHLGVQQELNRKGRNSPLPQAVQGAQVQLSGPASEPGIKDEFGKMFSGLGSGVGSMASPSAASGGAQTPFGRNHVRRDDLESVISQDSPLENGGIKLARTSSKTGSTKRRKQLKNEDGKADDESSTGRRTPSGRASKRPKSLQQSRRTAARVQSEAERASSQPKSAPVKAPVVSQAVSPPPAPENKAVVPHHHHVARPHHHAHHHHHHVSQHAKTVHVPQPIPLQIVRSEAVLNSVSHLPRQHLGHIMYEARIISNDDLNVDDLHLPFKSVSSPLPRFEGKENCTITVRISRAHLSERSRQEITAHRPVWGTDIYTDDSDVIAACIHAGWIRGEWGAYVDVSLLGLDLNVVDATRSNGVGKPRGRRERVEAADTRKVLAAPPAGGPMLPLSNRDLHVTILILPALESYASSIRFGLKSRPWKKNHDGLSFMIQSMKWISGVGTTKEATGEARRQRMRLSLAAQGLKDQLEEDELYRELFTSVDPVTDLSRTADVVQESFVRGDSGGGLANFGMGGWWKDGKSSRKSRKQQEAQVSMETRTEDHEMALHEPPLDKAQAVDIDESMEGGEASKLDVIVAAATALAPAVKEEPTSATGERAEDIADVPTIVRESSAEAQRPRSGMIVS